LLTGVSDNVGGVKPFSMVNEADFGNSANPREKKGAAAENRFRRTEYTH
jgi:hypothetical protein